MAKYRPGTLDDIDAVRRRLQNIERKADEANRPTGSNAFGTTEKVQNLDFNPVDAERLAQQAIDACNALRTDIQNGTVSTPEMTAAEVDAICTL